MTTDGYNYGKHETEWHDALVKHKIIEGKKKGPTEDAIDTKIYWEQKAKDPYTDKTLEEINEMEDDIEEDKLQELRRQRLKELEETAKLDKFGRVKGISNPEYTKEVAESSVEQPVVCILYVHGQEASQIMLKCLETLAAKFKSVKFVKIIGQDCIAGYKDHLCPTLVIYKDGDIVGNIKGLHPFGGKKAISANTVEWQLAQSTGIWKSTMEENPMKFKIKQIGSSSLHSKKYKIVNKDYDDGSDSDSLDLD